MYLMSIVVVVVVVKNQLTGEIDVKASNSASG